MEDNKYIKVEDNKYIKSLDLYLIDGTIADYGLLHKAVMRLSERKKLEEIDEFLYFLDYLVVNKYLASPSAMILRITLQNFKVIVSREIDKTAARLRG